MARLEIKLKEMELRVETREGEERKVDHQMCRCDLHRDSKCEHFMTLKMMMAMTTREGEERKVKIEI